MVDGIGRLYQRSLPVPFKNTEVLTGTEVPGYRVHVPGVAHGVARRAVVRVMCVVGLDGWL